jgi:hypothetical protein
MAQPEFADLMGSWIGGMTLLAVACWLVAIGICTTVVSFVQWRRPSARRWAIFCVAAGAFALLLVAVSNLSAWGLDVCFLWSDLVSLTVRNPDETIEILFLRAIPWLGAVIVWLFSIGLMPVAAAVRRPYASVLARVAPWMALGVTVLWRASIIDTSIQERSVCLNVEQSINGEGPCSAHELGAAWPGLVPDIAVITPRKR